MSDITPSSRLPVVAAVVAILAIAAVVVAVLFLGGDDPDEVDATAALEQADAAGDGPSTDDEAAAGDAGATDDPDSDEGDPADDGTAAGDDADEDPSEVAPDDAAASDATADGTAGIDGTWMIDTEAVEYSFDDNTGTFIGFRIDEELSNVGETEAVGRTPAVVGELTIEDSTVTATTITGDATALTTDRSQRDRRTREALGDGVLSFTLTDRIPLAATPAAGETVTVDATGELTVNGVTQPYTVPLSASLSSSGLLAVTSSFEVQLSDHAVTAPRAGPVLSVSDVATVEVQLFLTR